MMDEAAKLDEIRAALDRTGAAAKYGPAAATIIAAALSAVPVAGGPFAVLFQAAADKLTKPDLTENLLRLVQIVNGLLPSLDASATFEQRITVIEQAFAANPQAQNASADLAAEAVKVAIDPVTFRNMGGEQFVRDVIVDGRALRAIASDGGQSDFSGITQSGAEAEFFTTPGSRQSVSGSVFTRMSGSGGSQIGIGGAMFGAGQMTINDHGPNHRYGMVFTPPPGGGGAAITIGLGRTITFGGELDDN